MRRGSWALLLWLPAIATLVVVIAWGARKAWILDYGWIPPPLGWLIGVILLLIGRPWVRDEIGTQRVRPQVAWIIFAYSVALGLIGPMWWVREDRHSGPWFVLLLLPLAWVGVAGSARGEWARSIGAWLVLFGQFFALIYNITHDDSGIGCWWGWVY